MSTRTIAVVLVLVALGNFGLALASDGPARLVEVALGVTALTAAGLAFVVAHNEVSR